jgi:hypothetical protein
MCQKILRAKPVPQAAVGPDQAEPVWAPSRRCGLFQLVDINYIAEFIEVFLESCRVLPIHDVGFLQGVPDLPRKHTLREKIEQRIARKKGEDVFLTREFKALGGEDQVLRALRKLVDEGRLVRLGYGVYGRATVSSLSGKPMLYSRDGFAGVARQALDKLGVEWEPTEAERAYNEGRSTQVPVNPVVRVKGRFSRHLRYRNAELVLER